MTNLNKYTQLENELIAYAEKYMTVKSCSMNFSEEDRVSFVITLSYSANYKDPFDLSRELYSNALGSGFRVPKCGVDNADTSAPRIILTVYERPNNVEAFEEV